MSHHKTQYCIRPDEPADREEIIALYETVSGRERTDEWFNWKFVETPYAGDIRLFVAEAGDELAGVRGYLRMPMETGDGTLSAVYLLNMMVHPDHRGRGVSSQLTDHVVEHFTGDASFLFGLANQNSRPIYEHWGWTLVRNLRTRYRVQDPRQIATVFGNGRALGLLGQVGTVATQGYLSIKDRLARSNVDPKIAIHTESNIPATELASLYQRHVPSALHIRQDEPFYRWRFVSPDWESAAYIATRNGVPATAILTRTRQAFGGVQVTHLADVVPMMNDGALATTLGALLAHIIEDHRSSAVLAATDTAIPANLLGAYGFIPDDLPLFSLVHHPLTLVVKELDDCPIDVSEESNWLLPLAVRDTS
jgi:GNAT superfamily N-acetyltransferase